MFAKKVKKMVEVEVETLDLESMEDMVWEMFEMIICDKKISSGAAAITKLEGNVVVIRLYFCDELIRTIKLNVDKFKETDVKEYSITIAYIANQMALCLPEMKYE